MKALANLLVTLMLCLGSGTLSATVDTPFSSLPLGNRVTFGVKKILVAVSSKEGKFDIYKEVPYTPADGDLESLMKRELRSLPLNPKPGTEGADYYISGGADWSLDFGGENYLFKLEKTATSWRLPEKAFNFKLRYSGVSNFMPGITGYEVRARKGNQAFVFSTITDENTFGGTCNVPSAHSAVSNGILELATEHVSPDWDSRELTLLEGEKFVVLDRDGLPLRWSDEPPSFFIPPPTKPLKLAIRKVGDTLEVCLTGDGALYAIIEESADLESWGIPYSLSSPPEVSSTSGERRHVVDTTTGGLRFYRVRAFQPELQKQKQSLP